MKRGLFFSLALGLGLCLGVILLCLNAPKIGASNASPLASLNQSASEATDPAVSAALMPVRVNLEGQLGGPVNSIAISGNLAFLGTGYYLQIVDLTDLEHPMARGTVWPFDDLPFGSIVVDIKPVGDFVYVVSYGLQIVDVSNVDQPWVAGRYRLNHQCDAVDVQGDYAYLLCGFPDLVVLDISDPNNPSRVGELNLGKSVRDIIVSGDYAYLDAGYNGVVAVDVSDPTAPVEVTSHPGQVAQMALEGQYIYVIRGDNLHVVDISNPTSPQDVGLFEMTDYPQDVAVSNGMAFVASGVSLVHMIDVSQPDAPVEIAYFDTMSIGGNMSFDRSITVSNNTVYFVDAAGLWVIDAGQVSLPAQAGTHGTPGSARGLAKQDDLLYVADGESGLRILDVSASASISEVGYLDTPGISQDVAVSGTMAYVADGEEGLRIVDVSSPGSPVEIGMYADSQNTGSLALDDDLVFLTSKWSVGIIDVFTPTTPTLISTYPCSAAFDVATTNELLLVACAGYGLYIADISAPDQPVHLTSFPGGAKQVAVSGHTAYVSSDGSLAAVDISVPLTPTRLGQIYLPRVELSHDLDVAGGRAYLTIGKNAYPAEGDQGLVIIDVTDPAKMREIGRYATGADAFGVTYDNGLVYLGLGDSGVEVVDVSQVNGLMEASFYGLPLWTEAVAVNDGFAYVTDYSYGFKIIDVGQPAAPNWIGSLDQGWFNAGDIAISGTIAYVAESTGLRIVDGSEPSQPVQIGHFSMPNSYDRGVVVTGTLAYVTDGAGLYLIDISDPAQPEQLALFDEFGPMYHLTLAGNRLYASGIEFKVLDVSTPNAPSELGSCAVTGRIAVSGTTAYVATGGEIWSVIGVSDSASPQVVGSGEVPTYAEDVAVLGPYALVVDLNYGLRVFDVRDASAPKEVSYYDTPGSPKVVEVDNGLVYVADGAGGLLILSLQEIEVSNNYLPLIQR